VNAPELLWQPSEQVCARTHLSAYTRFLEQEQGLRFASYEQLWAWSVNELEAFWESLWRWFGVEATRGYERVLSSRVMPGCEWFPGAQLSYAERIFSGRRDAEPALLHASELRPLAAMSWAELRELTAAIRAGLVECGVVAGDRVAAYLPNLPETVAAFLACASLGATWSSAAPEFGTRAVVERFAQIEPKVLLAVDGYRYAGKDFDRRGVVAELRRELGSLERVFVLPYLTGEGNWQELLRPNVPLSFTSLPFDHPLWVLYSSGTTGLPKPIVHGQGGILLEHLKQHYLQLDLHRDERLFWFTTTGWMMWNFLVGGLLGEAPIVLYDGSPLAPDPGVLWRLAAEAGVTCLGTSAAHISSSIKSGLTPGASYDLSRLRAVGSTGSPLAPEAFRWIYDAVDSDTWLFSMSGGTDVCTAFVGGVPTLPVYAGELQARALGARVEAFDASGRSLVGAVGELVLTAPLPSMPVGFFGDASGERYRTAYFSSYPGVWRHGDWIEITPRGSAVIYGRSDATINRGGVRIGTSEIYSCVLALDEVLDALVVDADGFVPLFVVLRDGRTLDAELELEIRRKLRDECSPRHVPSEIHQAPAIPRTLSGKIVELPVKQILTGADPARTTSREALANPSALDWFSEWARRSAPPGQLEQR
jgi:acetoacetyl-CoA synthetase